MNYYLVALLLVMTLPPSFKETQRSHSRVREAYEEKEAVVKNLFALKKIPYANFDLFLRAFKYEKILEVWVKEKSKQQFTLLHTYNFCSTSGVLGPKRKEGDLQIPEGVYHINHFNPQSNFHLSLGISYPNASDKILSDKHHPGGAIYIHGNCVTIGCIPITDDKIKELYVLAVEAKSGGQEKIPVHIFPTRLEQVNIEKLIRETSPSEKVKQFWANLQFVYADFESSKKLRAIQVNQLGEYYFK
jgi:murein L,D-transpeptidase YafK